MLKRGLLKQIAITVIIVWFLILCFIIWSAVNTNKNQDDKNPIKSYMLSDKYVILANSVKFFSNESSTYVEMTIQRKENTPQSKGFFLILEDSSGASASYRINKDVEENATEKIIVNYSDANLKKVIRMVILPIFNSARGEEIIPPMPVVVTKNVSTSTSNIRQGGGSIDSPIYLVDDLTECEDNKDNDEDGLIDFFDAGCFLYGDEKQDKSRTKTWIYSWSTPLSIADNIIPFHWLVSYIPLSVDVNYVKNVTDKMPEGNRVLFLADWNRRLIGDYWVKGSPLDNCTTKEGKYTDFICVWPDNGAQLVYDDVEDFFRRYNEIGGKVDVVVQDFEQGYSIWGLGTRSANETLDDYYRAHYNAIENDPRFPSLGQQLGFTNLTTLWDYRNYPTNYLIWDNLMMERVAGYLNRITYEPVKKYYPNVKMSNYGYGYHSKNYPMPDFNSHKYYLYGTGAHVGTHQSLSLYGHMNGPYRVNVDGNINYAESPFNAMRWGVNELRVMKLSSDVPLMPWMADGLIIDNMKNNDMHKELELHTLLTGVSNLLWWNVALNKPEVYSQEMIKADEQKFSSCLKEFDKLCGFEDKRSLVTNLTSWTDDFVITGMQAGGRNIWRFTPEDSKNNINDVLKSTSPVVFQTTKARIVFNNATIYSGNCSSKGYWIVQDQTQKPIIENL